MRIDIFKSCIHFQFYTSQRQQFSLDTVSNNKRIVYPMEIKWLSSGNSLTLFAVVEMFDLKSEIKLVLMD